MAGEERVEAGDGGDLVARGVPIQRRRAVDIEFGRREPFDACGDAERPLLGKERGERGAQARPGFTAGGEAVVVVSFGELDQRSARFGADDGGRKFAFKGGAVLHLERLRVGPVEVGGGEEVVGGLDLAAETLEEKDRFGKGLPHAGGDRGPGLGGDHVARITAEAVYALAAPEEKDLGHEGAKASVGEVQLDEIGPDDAPGAGRLKGAIGGAAEPVGVVGEQDRGPAGVIGGDIEEEAGAAGVDGVGQFAELVDRGGAGVEHGKRRVDIEQVTRGKGRAIKPHAGEGGGDGMDREKLDDAKAHHAEDGIEPGDQIAERARGGDDRVVLGEEGSGQLGISGGMGARLAGGTELADKGGVDGVGVGGVGRGDLDGEITAVGPFRDIRACGNEAGLAGKPADLGQRNGEDMSAVAEVAHGDVVPITRQRRLASLGGGNDFAAAAGGVAEIGAEDGAAVAGAGEVERDRQRVARDLEQAGAGRRMLLKRHGWATFTNADTEGRTSILPVSAERNKTKKSPTPCGIGAYIEHRASSPDTAVSSQWVSRCQRLLTFPDAFAIVPL